MKKYLFLVVIMLLVFSGSSYAADHWATTDMSWAEFYAGETNSTAAQLKADGLDAISTPTTNGLGRFPLLWGQSVDQVGTVISGEKAVQVHMTDAVYETLKDNPRFTFSETAFTEYKEANADGSFGKMITQESKPTGATVSIASGASATWGHYVLSVSGAEIEIGSANRYCDYYLGGLLETSDGKVYGLRHDNNLWSNTDIAFTINENFTEIHGTGVKRFYEYTKDLEGKTITKITYMLKNKPDIVFDNLNLFVKNQTTATVNAVYPSGKSAYLTEGGNIAVSLNFANVPAGVTYTPSSVYMGSGRNRTPITAYTYANNTLTLTGPVQAGNYTVVFSSERYVDISASFNVYTVDATNLIMSPDNNLGSVNFLLTPAGVSDATDKALKDNNFVNASDYTDVKKNYSAIYNAGENEVAGSGISFDIVLDGVSADKHAIVGFGKIIYLTSENLGERYSKVYSTVNAMPSGESGYKEFPNLSSLKEVGLKVMNIRADGTKRDISEFTGAGMMISDDNNILVYYGSMLADCNVGTITEGEYALSDEGETLIADGVKDNHIKAAVYFEAFDDEKDDGNNNDTTSNDIVGSLGSSSSGCEIFSPFMLLALIPLISRKK